MDQGGERVVVRTGTVEVVDDVVEKVDWGGGGEEGVAGKQKNLKRGRKRKKGKETEGPGDVEMGDAEEIFMKTRKTSMVEIIISSTTVN